MKQVRRNARTARCVLMLTGLIAGAVEVQGQTASQSMTPRSIRTLAARHTEQPLVIDGVLDDEAWSSASAAGDFVQLRPNPGQPATERTDVRVLYDADAIYVGFRLYDGAPDSLTSMLARRDFAGHSDWAHVVIDSYHDGRTAYRFGINPAGVKKDVFHFDDTREDATWDAVWEAAARMGGEGWTAEFRIPLSQLRFRGSSAGERQWGINFVREVARRDEVSLWSPVPPDAPGYVSEFGKLTGLEALRSGRRIEVVPYSVGRLARTPLDEANALHERNDFYASAGADVRVGIGPGFTLTAALNPDFGQVEADPSQVNLTAYELFQAERRPFFQEGTDIFQLNIGMPFSLRQRRFGNDRAFYSRRIGRAPQGKLPADANGTEAPANTRILAAMKVSGKTADGWSLGVLNALTGKTVGRYVDGVGETHRATLEPLANFAVLRVTRDLGHEGSALGGLITTLHRRFEEFPAELMPESALLAGVDGRYRFLGGDYQLSGALLGSRVAGHAAAISTLQRSSRHYFQRPDAQHVDLDSSRTSLTGSLATAELQKQGGAWRWSLTGHSISPGFENNEAGFGGSSDWRVGAASVSYNLFHPAGPLARGRVALNARSGWSWGGERLATHLDGIINITTRGRWDAYVGATHEFPALLTHVLRGGPSIRAPGYATLFTGVTTDRRNAVSGELGGYIGAEDESRSHWFGINPQLWLRPSSRLELSFAPSYGLSHDDWSCAVAPQCLAGTEWLLAQLDHRTASLSARVNYTFSRDLSLQFYAQPFVSTGRYTAFRRVADPRASAFDERLPLLTGKQLVRDAGEKRYHLDMNEDGVRDASFTDPDFTVREVRANAILRWEYRPGSAIMAVWIHDRAGWAQNADLALRRTVPRLLSDPPANTLLVKATYWLDL